MKKIVFITPFYRPSIGGVEYIVYHTARELLRHGFEVHIVTTTHDNRWRKITDTGTYVEEDIYIYRLKPMWLKIGYATIIKGLKNVIRKISPDIVHCHNLHPHVFQAIKWKKLGYSLIAQLHFPVATGFDHFTARLIFRLVMLELVRSQHKVDAFIAHTNMERQWLVNEGIKKSRIHIVRFPGIPDELLQYKPEGDIHNKLSVSTVISYVSRIHPRKGQHLLIEVAKYLRHQFKDFKIYIAGPPSDQLYLKKLYELEEKFDLSKYIVIDPRPLSEEEKLDVIATSDVFVCTTLRDIHPIVILESLALKTPVVATNVGGIPEMLNQAIAIKENSEPSELLMARKLKYIIQITDVEPKSISDAISRVIGHKGSKYNEVFKFAVKPYIMSKVVKQLIQVYRSLRT